MGVWQKFMLKLSDEDSRLLGLLLTPSWLSGLIAVVVGLTISVGVIIAFDAHNSQLQQQLIAWQDTQPQPALTTPGQAVPANNRPTLQGNWSLLVLWSLVGLLVYGLVATIIRSVSRAEELRESLDYVHARPRAILASMAEHLLLRVTAAILLAILIMVFWRQIVPYSIAAAHASDSDLVSFDGSLYALLSFALIAISLHAQTILLRLVLGRSRVFHET